MSALSPPDPQLEQIRHAFGGAFRRMRAAETETELVSELSNQLYRLGELCRKRQGLTKPAFYGAHGVLAASADLRAARAAMWARTFDTHDVFVVASVSDLYTDYYTEMYGVLAWRPLSSLPAVSDKYGRDADYAAELQGKAVLDSSRRALDALAASL